jgi:hypothetical protein
MRPLQPRSDNPMRAFQFFFATACALATTACGGGGDAPAPVAIYKSLGSLQCSGGGTTVSVLQQQLAVAGIQALAASCGIDGLGHVAACGAADGRIGIIDIPAQALQLATTLGYSPLSVLPAPLRQACS